MKRAQPAIDLVATQKLQSQATSFVLRRLGATGAIDVLALYVVQFSAFAESLFFR